MYPYLLANNLRVRRALPRTLAHSCAVVLWSANPRQVCMGVPCRHGRHRLETRGEVSDTYTYRKGFHPIVRDFLL